MKLEENQIMAIDIRKFLHAATGKPGFIKSQNRNRTCFLVELSTIFRDGTKTVMRLYVTVFYVFIYLFFFCLLQISI